ncbi:MAG TPA: LytTR family DNA-binding domain-containing protein [Saprospiraceae bacterium]|nr:LytTR family DNA-binding domain-containing protein [Saprospiraceae bacterium]HNT19256.1 LytTR family DNA-binding domain-containing protein [Saprospiraceae bacterium]
MTKIKTILVDDEKNSLESLAFEIGEYCPAVEIVAACQDPFRGKEMIERHQPDLIFLDVEMPGMNGFELLQQIPGLSSHVVFITAYDQFAVKAFEFNAVDYLLKPVRISKLISSVQKVLDRVNQKLDRAGLEALVQNLQLKKLPGIENIALPTQEGFKMVRLNEISYLEAESNYTWVVMADRKKYLVTRTLKEMEDQLSQGPYLRVHKSYLVNLNGVDRYVRGQGGYLIMKDQSQVPVARTQKEVLLRSLKL